MPAACLHYRVPKDKKEQILHDYHTNKLQVLTNVDLLTEGWDEPVVNCIVMARLSLSSIFFTQAIGRGLRLFPGKDYCLLLDFTDNIHTLTLGAPPDIDPQARNSKTQVDLFDHPALFDDDDFDEYSNVFQIDPSSGDYIITSKNISEVDLLNTVFAWNKIGDHWILNIGIDEGSLIVFDQGGDGLHCYLYHFKPNTFTKNLCGPVALDFCLGMAQEKASKVDSTFSKRERQWRNEIPSAGQIKAINGLGIKETVLNRGHAGALISLKLFLFSGLQDN